MVAVRPTPCLGFSCLLECSLSLSFSLMLSAPSPGGQWRILAVLLTGGWGTQHVVRGSLVKIPRTASFLREVIVCSILFSWTVLIPGLIFVSLAWDWMRCHRVITPTPKRTQPSTLGFSHCLRIQMSKSMIPINFSIRRNGENDLSFCKHQLPCGRCLLWFLWNPDERWTVLPFADG